MTFGYWKVPGYLDPYDNTIKWKLDNEKLFRDIYRNMNELEEAAALDMVIEILKAKGYKVTKDD